MIVENYLFEIMLLFAKDNLTNNLISILDADKEGEYICCSCGCKLIPKKGNIVSHHFAHYDTEECRYAQETALHQVSKVIFQEAKKSQEEFCLPSAFVKYTYLDPNGFRLTKSKCYINERNNVFIIEGVEVEKRLNNFQPDIVLTLRNKITRKSSKLLVEIAVTHFIDIEKRQKIIKSGLSCVEIDISAYKNSLITIEKMRSLLLEGGALKSWIYNVKKSLHLQELKKDIDQKVQIDIEKQRKADAVCYKRYLNEIGIGLLNKHGILSIIEAKKYWRKGLFHTEYHGVYERRYEGRFYVTGYFTKNCDSDNYSFCFFFEIERLETPLEDVDMPEVLVREVIKQCKDYK